MKPLTGSLPDILWNVPSHNAVLGMTDTENSPAPLFTCAITCRSEHDENRDIHEEAENLPGDTVGSHCSTWWCMKN